MKINLNNVNDFTLENVKRLIASEDDSVNTQFRVTDKGYLFLSKDVGSENLEGILFSLETNGAGNGYVGIDASQDEDWVTRVYEAVKKNYPTPTAPYIDDF